MTFTEAQWYAERQQEEREIEAREIRKAQKRR
jgi:hypothetical protein